MGGIAHGLAHMFHAHDPRTVVVSFLLAVFTSYVALEFAGRIKVTGGWKRLAWLAAGSIAMGGGIWSMHFIAMLGLVLPFTVTYDLPLTALSFLSAIVFSAIGLYAVFCRSARWYDFVVGGLLMGLGIAAMHYMGMAALEMPAITHYGAGLVALSLLISVVAAGAALWLGFQLSQFYQRAGSAVLMGFAVFGMHFTAMAAFSVVPTDSLAELPVGISAFHLVEGIGAATVVILLAGLGLVYQDRVGSRLSQLTVAQFGISAISTEDLTTVFHRAVDTARGVLGVEYGSVAAINLRTGQIKTVSAERTAMVVRNYDLATVPPDSILRYAVQLNQPFSFNDIERQSKFAISKYLKNHGVVSGVVVPKVGKDGEIMLISMFSVNHRHYAREDIEFVQSMADVLTILRERDTAMMDLRLRNRALEAITQGITVVDPLQEHYPTVYSNPAFAEMTGYTEDEIANISSVAFLPDANIDPFAGGDGSNGVRVEVPIRRKDGSLFLDNIAVGAIRDDAGTVTHYVTVHEDVTRLRADQRRLDQKVREQSALAEFSVIAFQSENLGDLLKRAADYARLATDTNFAAIVDVDVAADSVKIVAQSGLDNVVSDTYKISSLPSRALVPTLLKTRQPIIFSDLKTEARFTTDDVLKSIEVRSGIALIAEGADGIVSLLYILSKDVREYSEDDASYLSTLLNLVVAVRERHATLMRLRLRDRALDSISQGIIISDESTPATNIIYTNPAFAKMTGYTIDQIIGRPSKHFLAEDAPPGILDTISLNRAKRRAAHFESRTRRKDGTSFLDAVDTSPILSADGDLTHYVSVHQDLTETRQRDEQLRESQKMEAVGQLTGGIAHDFNNLLTVVKANAEDLKDELVGAPLLQRQADMVLQAADRGADLVRQLMAFARKQELEPRIVNLNTMLDPFVKLVRRTMQENIDIETVRHEGLPPVRVDPSRLENAILNLCINARDAMPDGGRILIETGMAVLDRDYVNTNPGVSAGEYVMISVSDTGSGMSKEVMEKAFQPFFTTKEIGRGTGLGLSMVYGFVKQSGGHAKLYSELGIGTTIKIYLPPIEKKNAEDDAATDHVGSTNHKGTGNILVVEDDELVRQSVCAKLERLGYGITQVSSADEAIATLEKNPRYNLVFTDVIMPGEMTGADLAREIRKRWPGISLLMTSGYTEASALGKIKMPDGVRLLSKPYSNANLADAIEAALTGREPNLQRARF